MLNFLCNLSHIALFCTLPMLYEKDCAKCLQYLMYSFKRRKYWWCKGNTILQLCWMLPIAFSVIAIFVLITFDPKCHNMDIQPKSIGTYWSWFLMYKWGPTWIPLAIFVIYSAPLPIFILHESILSMPIADGS